MLFNMMDPKPVPRRVSGMQPVCPKGIATFPFSQLAFSVLLAHESEPQKEGMTGSGIHGTSASTRPQAPSYPRASESSREQSADERTEDLEVRIKPEVAYVPSILHSTGQIRHLASFNCRGG